MQHRILICDDEDGMRRYLTKMLSGWGHQPEAFATPLLLLRFLESNPGEGDLLLLDVKMPEMDGIEACRAIARLPEPPLIVMLTTFEEPAIVRAAADAGAAAYLSKETSPDTLASAIRGIVEHPERRWIPRVEVPELTPREGQVLELLAEGCSNKEMAKRLGLSPETIKDYLNGVYRKLEVRDRLGALARAREMGLVER